MRSKEYNQQIPLSVNFFNLYDEVEKYLKQIETHGGHSFHGKFYRRVVKEKQAEMMQIIEEFLTNTKQFEMSFADLVEVFQQEQPYVSASMVMYDLLDAGEYQIEGKIEFENVIMIGMYAMGGY